MALYVSVGAREAVEAVLPADGGELSYEQVVDALNASGRGEFARDLIPLSMSKQIKTVVRPQPEGRAKVFFSKAG